MHDGAKGDAFGGTDPSSARRALIPLARSVSCLLTVPGAPAARGEGMKG